MTESLPQKRLTVVWHGALVPEYRKPFQWLHGRGWEVSLIVPDCWTLYVSQPLHYAPEPNEPIKVYPLPVRYNWHGATFSYKGIFNVLNQTRPDLLFVYEEPYSLAANRLARWSRKHAIPLVVQTCQDIFKTYPPPFRWMEKAVLQTASVMLGLNQTCLEVLKRKGFSGPMAVIPSGIDPARYASGKSVDDLSKKHMRTLGYVGRLSPEKGIDCLLQALAKLPDQYDAVIAGDGPEKVRLLELSARLGISGRVRWLGAVDHGDLPEVYARMGVLILPSRTQPNWQEQFGRVLIEAMASGVPVIATRCGAIPEVVGEAGILIDEDDTESLIQTIARLTEDRDLRLSLIHQGHERIAANYTFQSVAEMYDRAFQQAFVIEKKH